MREEFKTFADLPLIERALEVAKIAHGDQKRKYTDEPYVTHCVRVAFTVFAVGARDELISAALLHDVVEDTDVTLEELEELFGAEVASLVEQVTDVSRPEDGNRAVRKKLDREHLALASAEGATLKLADLLDNHSDISRRDPDFARVYRSEARLTLKLLQHGDKRLLFHLSSVLMGGEK